MGGIQNLEAAGYDADIIQNLKDAGCNTDIISEVCLLCDAGEIQDAVKVLRRYRLSLMEHLHESQNRVDCLDFLVYQLEKTRNL